MKPYNIIGAATIVAASVSSFAVAQDPSFALNRNSGLSPVANNKYWSPVIADFDRDGNYDLVLSNHGRQSNVRISPEIYWGKANGSFTPYVSPSGRGRAAGNEIPTSERRDLHGFSAGYFGKRDRFPDLILTMGGLRGTVGNSPILVEFSGGRTPSVIFDRQRNDGLLDPSLSNIGMTALGSGRSSYFVDLDLDGDLDLIHNNARNQTTSTSKFIFEWKNNKYNLRSGVGAISGSTANVAALIDANKDGYLDVIYGAPVPSLWINRRGSFSFRDGKSLLPNVFFSNPAITAFAEIDYDRDGFLDLYVTRGRGLDRPGTTEATISRSDFLFRWDNVAKKYVDVSAAAGIPSTGSHQGVSVGDFNNDGWNDIFISVFSAGEARKFDKLLVNNGNGTFRTITRHGATVKRAGEDGNQTEVFDFNKDGKLDILSGSKEGPWRVFLNNTANAGNYVTVRVGNSNRPEKFSSLGARVIVRAIVNGKKRDFIKRVGSQGQSHGQSFTDVLHFGLGEVTKIKQIRVIYGFGKTDVRRFPGAGGNVNRTYTVGNFPN